MLKRSNLHDYQPQSIDFGKEKKRCALWLPMGAGKTSSSLTLISDLIDEFAISKTLVIAPLRVANSVWHKETQIWEHLTHLTYSICTGTEKQRIAALQKPADLYVINRENTEWLLKYLLSIKNVMFDMIVIDESDSFKNPSSRRFKALKKLAPKTEYFIELTGTPSPKGYLDLWAQIYLLDEGKRLGKTFTAYKQRFFNSDYMGYNWTLKDGADKQIRALISDIVFSVEQTTKIKQVDIIRDAELPPKVAKQYKEFEKEFVLELESNDIEALNAASLTGKLQQICNGAIYHEDKSFIVLHDIKIEMLKEILEPLNEPVLVAYQFKSDLERLLKAFPQGQALSKDEQMISDWNAKKIPLLFVHPASAGHGLNIQFGGSMIVWFGLTFNLAYYQQLIARLARQGQTETVRNIHLIMKNTIEEKIMQAIENKAKTQNELLDYVKNLYK